MADPVRTHDLAARARLAPAPTAGEGGEVIDHHATPIVARVDGVHVVESDSHVDLAVKTHLAHFFDPSTGEPLR